MKRITYEIRVVLGSTRLKMLQHNGSLSVSATRQRTHIVAGPRSRVDLRFLENKKTVVEIL